MNLVQKYLELVNEVVSFDEYENKKAVKEYNRKVTQMRKIASQIESSHPTLKNEFCELLYHNNSSIRIWVAHHVLEVINCDQCYRKTALQEIRHYANTDKTAGGLGNKMWLEDWYKTHPTDKLL